MPTGSITSHIDVAQVVLYTFWLFFAGLIFYLRREDRREGYPLRTEPSGRPETPGFVAIPEPKVFRLFHGGTETAPRRDRDTRPLNAAQDRYPGSPLRPLGNPMLDGVGPGAWVERAETPDLTVEGLPRIVPMRIANDYSVADQDPDPRGMPVFGADGLQAGVVRDLWVDRSEAIIRYLEIEVEGAAGKHVLLPMTFAQVNGRKNRVKVVSVLASQFADAPALSNLDRITAREEDKVSAYYGGGILYAEPSRQEPLI